MVALGYVNVYLVEGAEGLVVVDSGLPDRDGAIIQALEEVGHQPSLVSDILITHYHLDHIGSLAPLASATGARVHAPRLEADVIRKGSATPRMKGRNVIGRLMSLVIRPRESEPTEVHHELDDRDALDLAGGFTVIHTPGHSPGHLSYMWREGRALIAGDAAGNVMGGLGPPPVAEDIEAAGKSFVALAALDFEVAVFGHGKPITTGASEAFKEASIKV